MFNHLFYNNFHLDIKSLQLNKQQLEQSYQLYGKKEGRISCEEDFYKVYPDFDIEFYKNAANNIPNITTNIHRV